VSCVAIGADLDARVFALALRARQRSRDTETSRRAIRVATARRLVQTSLTQNAGSDNETNDRYVWTQSGYGITLEEFALRLFMTPLALRQLITRVSQR
jgi:hypothetical protein